MTAAATAELIRQRLADLPEVMPDLRLLVLFGSAARDRTRSESDIDLAVQCDGPADLEAVYLALAPAARDRSFGPDRPPPRRSAPGDGRGAHGPSSLRARTRSVPWFQSLAA